MSSLANGGKRKEENRHISFDMSGSSVSVVKTAADMEENLEKRNQRRNKLFRRIQMDIKAKCFSIISLNKKMLYKLQSRVEFVLIKAYCIVL